MCRWLAISSSFGTHSQLAWTFESNTCWCYWKTSRRFLTRIGCNVQITISQHVARRRSGKRRKQAHVHTTTFWRRFREAAVNKLVMEMACARLILWGRPTCYLLRLRLHGWTHLMCTNQTLSHAHRRTSDELPLSLCISLIRSSSEILRSFFFRTSME